MKKWLQKICIILLILVCVLPFSFVLFQSYLNSDGQLSGIAYYQVFLAEPVYLFRFWKSLLMCLFIVVGQLVVTVLGGFGFAKYNFPGKHILFTILMILMTLPVQVILVPSYILFDKLHMLDSWSALILPAAFSPLGTFITMQSFKAIPNEVIDAAKIDGCNLMQVLRCVVIPIARGGIISAGILAFLDSWNMVEQPLAYLKSFAAYPLSVALSVVFPSEVNVQMAASLLVLIPPLLLFLYFNHDLVEGIVIGEEK